MTERVESYRGACDCEAVLWLEVEKVTRAPAIAVAARCPNCRSPVTPPPLMKATNASSVSITIATPARVSATPTRSTTDDREDAMSEALAATLRLDVEAYQRAASTALAELRLFLDTGDNDRLHSFVSWSHTADSARDVLKRKAGM